MALDVQRTDLWRLGMSNVIGAISQALSAVPGNPRATAVLQALPAATEVPFYAAHCDFSQPRIEPAMVRRDNSVFHAPGYDGSPGTVSVRFIHEITDPTSTYRGSTMWAVIEGWRALARVGQPPNPNSSELALALNDLGGNSTLNIPYAFTVYAELVNGVLTQSGFPDAGFDMEVKSRYSIVNAWPASVRLGAVSHSDGASILMVDVVLACDAFEPS